MIVTNSGDGTVKDSDEEAPAPKSVVIQNNVEENEKAGTVGKDEVILPQATKCIRYSCTCIKFPIC